jgi:hypothetical protein
MTLSDPRAARSLNARPGLPVSPVDFAVIDTPVRPAPWLVGGARQSLRPLFGGEDAVEEFLTPEEQRRHAAAAADTEERARRIAVAPPAHPAGSTPSIEPPAPPVSQTISSMPPAAATPPPPAPPPAPVRDPNSEAFARAVVEHATAARRALATVEEQLLELSVQLAEVLVEREIEREPALLGTLARAALASLDGVQPVSVRASRASYGAIVDTFGGPSIEFEGVQVRVVLDTKLDGVGVVVEGPDTRVDGRVADRLRSALRAMQDERARRESEVAP